MTVGFLARSRRRWAVPDEGRTIMLVLPCLFACASGSASYLTQRLAPFDLDVHSFTDTGRGLRTLRDRKKGELILSVADTEVILAERVLGAHEDLIEAARHAAGSATPLTDEAILACHILRERASDSEYARTLPECQPSGVSMTLSDHELLPRCYARAAEASRAYAIGQHAACSAALAATGAPPPPLDAFLEAFSHVRARSVEVGDDIGQIEPPSEWIRAGSGRRRALLPAFDLLNHQAGAAASLVRSEGDGSTWRLVAERAYGAGEQVFISYGARDNLKLLLQYGFAVADNEEAVVLFGVAELLDGCAAAPPMAGAAVLPD